MVHYLDIGERSHFYCFLYTYCDSVQNKITFFKKVSWNFTRRSFLMSRSFMILFMVPVDIHGKQKFAFNFDLILYYFFYNSLKGRFFSNRVVSLAEDIKRSSVQLKIFN